MIAGRTSVVLVNYRGAADTLTCLQALTQLDIDPAALEVICVDNASGDDSVAQLRAHMPTGTVLIESPVNGGFTGGCNLGAQAATGEFIAFINNDARPDPGWLSAGLAALRADATVGCVASKVLDWDGVDIDFVDAGLTWYGMGYKPLTGVVDDGSNDDARDVLFATGSAMIVRADVFRELDGFDERLFMFYEDVDFGWRLNLLGGRVRYVPTSVVYHRHHATIDKFGSFREWYLLERNALICLYKNLEDETLGRVLAPAMALANRRALVSGGADSSVLDLARNPPGAGGFDDQDDLAVSKRSLTASYALDGFLELLPSLTKSRAEFAHRRLRTDRALAPLMRNPIEPASADAHLVAGHHALVDAFRIADLYTGRAKVLVVTGDPLGAQLAGPAIRAVNIAHELEADNEVRLISTRGYPTAKLRADVAWAEVIVFQGFLLHDHPWIAATNKVLVADLYDPMHLERLEQTRGVELAARRRDIASTVEVVNQQLRRGDFFLCANERQRHFWLGQLAALGRLNPRTYDHDQTLDGLVAVTPFGLPDRAPTLVTPAIKGVVDGIGKDDKVILWAGGIYDWFDPQSLIRAVAALAQTHDDVRLFFLGTSNPNPGVPPMPAVAAAKALAAELGVLDRVVFFNDGWVDYDQRYNYLADADVGVSTHFEHLETTFSFRTRILDYLWAGLPIVATRGDHFGDLIDGEGLGVAVNAGDVEELTAALQRCLYDQPFADSARAAIARVRPNYVWTVALAPLIEFCRAPHRAFDADPKTMRRRRALGSVVPERWLRDAALARQYLADGGVRNLSQRVVGRVRRIARGRR